MDATVVQSMLSDLDEDQREAVVSTEGPVLVIAGPGSGKTRTITYRFAYILLTDKASPLEILCVTFTNKSANEMKTRISNLLRVPTSRMWIKTFHSLGLSIVKENYHLLGLKENFVVYDKADELRLVKELMRKYGFEELSPEQTMEIIDKVRYGDEVVDVFGDTIRDLTKMYEETLRKNNAVDFTDLIILPHSLLSSNEEVRDLYKRRWRYVMIDEFQDTDPVQYGLIRLLLNPMENICVVGDDDQSIYGWRGAKVENIRNFDKDFKNCKVVILKTNYRSTEEVIRLSNFVSSAMLFRRKEKSIKGIGRKGIVPKFVETYSQLKEAEIIAEEIDSLVRLGYSYKDIAVFYRVNYLSRILEEVLLKSNIPYRVYSGTSFYERAEIKDILAYMKFFVNRNDFVSFSRIANVPRRGLGEASLSKILDFSLRSGKDLIESALMLEKEGIIGGKVKALAEALEVLEGEESIASRVRMLISKIGYYNYLKNTYNDYEDRIENVEELLTAINEFENSGGRTIEEFVNSSALMTGLDDVDETKDCVSLMTLHVSKGLEFPVVFIFGAVDGIIPYFRSFHSQSLLDEERRLFYVGITRAKSRLVITASRYVRIGSKHIYVSPTRFIEEVPEEYMEIVRV
ncbi:MAG: UvrD-helicase domain-containing protein [Brevinematia bacterium]